MATSTIPIATAERALRPPTGMRRLWQSLPAQSGAFWVLLAIATPRVLGPVFTIALRRFLGPGSAGTFDLAYTPYKFLDNFRNFGTGPALIFRSSVDTAAANTAWTLNVLFAVIVTTVAQLLAHPIALYYGHPQIEGVLRVLSIAYVFASVGSVHFFLLMRDLDFRTRSVPALGQVVAGGVIALLFAVWGFGVGTLVARELTSVVGGAVLLWVVYPFRPRVQLVPSEARQILRYGAWIGIGLTTLYMSQNVDVFIGGRIIRNTGDVGFYTTSWRLAFIAAGVFTTVASSMVFPTLSRLQNHLAALQTTLLTSIRQLALVMLPAAWLLAALAPIVIVPLFGDKWAPYRSSFLVLSLLAVYAGNRTMLSIFFEGYKAVGKPWIVPVYNTVKLAIMVPAIIYGAQHGILGLALTYIPVQILELPAALLLADQVLDLSPVQVWNAVRTPILATVLMTAAVVATESALLGEMHLGDIRTLALCLPVAGAVYLGTLLLIDRRILLEARGVLLKGI